MRALFIALPILAMALPALAQPRVGEVIGPDKARTQTRLAAEGYRLTGFEVEHGRLEINAVKGEGHIEIKADQKTGKVLKVEARKGLGDHE
jgi:hypothetical protein